MFIDTGAQNTSMLVVSHRIYESKNSDKRILGYNYFDVASVDSSRALDFTTKLHLAITRKKKERERTSWHGLVAINIGSRILRPVRNKWSQLSSNLLYSLD